MRHWSQLVPKGGAVLDVACGSGRHVRWFTEHGHRVTGIDRDAQAIAPLAAIADVILADIESGPWPLAGKRFAGVVVTNYLWRPLAATIVDSVAPGGCLIWETFADGNQTVGRPSNPDFLLQPGELLHIAAGLRVVGYEDGFLDDPARFVQRIAAVRDTSGDAPGTPPGRIRAPAKIREF